MKRREDRPITKHTLNLYSGDYEELMALYSTRVGAAKIIRDLVHAHLRRIKETAAQQTAHVETLDIDLGPRGLMNE